MHAPNVRDVVTVLKLGYTTRHHHGEQVEEEGTVLSQLQESIFTQLLEPAEMKNNMYNTTESVGCPGSIQCNEGLHSSTIVHNTRGN